MYFTDLGLDEDLLDALYDMHFDECTPVQEQCIPHILQRRDLIGIAQTGTGKTAAYLLPLLTLLREGDYQSDAVNCLIMAPTRELAKQIDQALQGFSYYMNINGVAVYGGNDGARYEQERRSLSSGADIVIATPGRLITHMSLGTLDLSRTTHLVLDEADRMLDMGFSEDIMKIVEQMPNERQTILFSATMPPKIATLARKIMKNPVEVRLAVSKPAEKIQQEVYVCREVDKLKLVKWILEQKNPQSAVIFASSKMKVKDLYASLKRMGLNVAAMHSDLEQSQRDEVMLAFKAQRVSILVATDIVARGIDIDGISLVVNFDAPHDAEDYVHRIGRTARAGREGSAVTLIGEKEQRALSDIERILDIKIPRGTLPNGMESPSPVTERDGHSRSGGKQGRKRNRKPSGRKKQGEKQNQVAINENPGKSSESSESAKKEQEHKAAHGKKRRRSGKKNVQSAENL